MKEEGIANSVYYSYLFILFGRQPLLFFIEYFPRQLFSTVNTSPEDNINDEDDENSAHSSIKQLILPQREH